MDRFALTAFWRSLTRHRLYAALNVGGLAVGIAVFLVLGLYVRFETGFERWLPGHDRAYVVQTVWSLPESSANGAYPYTMGGLLEQMRQDFPGIVGTRIRGGERGGSVLKDGRAIAEDVAQVDPAFFDVFDLPMARGTGRGATWRPTDAYVSETAALRYFGTVDAVGRTLNVTMDRTQGYRVAGVFRDLPANTDLKLAVLTLLPRTPPSEMWFHWGSAQLQTFLRFDTPAAARAFEGRMRSFVNRRGRELTDDSSGEPFSIQQLRLLPLADLHLTPQGLDSASARNTVTTLGLVGLLTLLIAVVNYVNLSTARAGLRAREVAMRKVLGADRGRLLRQFLGEAVLTVAAAAVIGLALAELGLPFANAAGGLSLSIPYLTVVPALAVLTLVVGLLAGLYPAAILSRFPAAAVLASARSPGGGRAGTRLREALVLVQFGLAIAFMIGTAVLVAQTRHVRRADLGFDRQGLLVIRSTVDTLVTNAQRRTFLTAVAALPMIRGATYGNVAAGGSGSDNSTNVPLPGVAGPGPSLRWGVVGPRFFETHGARLIAGRLFDDAHGADDAGPRKGADGMNIVVNRAALKTLRLGTAQRAIGRTLGGSRPRTVIGVVDDLRFASPRTPNPPTYYLYYRQGETMDQAVAIARFAGDPRAASAAVEGVWRRLVPQVPFSAETAEESLAKFYRDDERATRLFAIGAVLAVLIGCVGLWGLASFNTARRVREIGIRKTLGATSGDVVKLLVGEFLRPVLLANLFAWPLAWVTLTAWLSGFEDRVALSPLYFLVAGLAAAAIAVATILGHALRTSRATPAWALRHE